MGNTASVMKLLMPNCELLIPHSGVLGCSNGREPGLTKQTGKLLSYNK